MKMRTILMSIAFGLIMSLGLIIGLNPDHSTKAAGDETAATRCVKPGGGDGCFIHIQDAVNASNDGDVIRVAQGSYLETLLITESITLEGGWNTAFTERNWDVYPTEINGDRAGSVIRFDGNISPTIEGFVITGGDGSSYLGWGGGILADGDWDVGGLITIRHNIIRDNIACSSSCQGYGGGIFIYSNRFAIENNTIEGNVARSAGSGNGKGGGIVLWGYPSSGTLIDNIIISNTAVISPVGSYASGQGGGIWSDGACDLTVIGNEIRGNFATQEGEGYGGGVYACGDFYENRILTNTASVNGKGFGGGVYGYYAPDFIDNVVQGNVASDNSDGTGGGIYAVYLQDAHGNTISKNRATRGGGVFYQEYAGNQTFHQNLVSENSATGTDISNEDGGGGISSAADWLEITDNLILTNTGLLGGGLLVTGGDRYLVDQNQVSGNSAFAGGGLFVYSATGVIEQNQIIDNHTLWWGGGLYLYGKASPVLNANTVLSNSAHGYSGFAGGGMMIAVDADTHVTVTNHIIANNWVDTETAGGIHCLSGTCSLINCTIVDNKLGANPGEGVRIGAADDVNMVWNSIIAGHNNGIILGGSATADIDYNDFYNNSIDVSGASPGSHNLNIDPLFRDWPGGDFHLTRDSLLINAADSNLSVPDDIDGWLRINQPDIGADEFIWIYYLPGMFNEIPGFIPPG